MTPKPEGFRTLDVETSSSQKGYKAKLAIQSIKLNFHSFYVNIQCLVRQEVWYSMSTQSDDIIYFIFLFFFFFLI
jgi:hypothetical protein